MKLQHLFVTVLVLSGLSLLLLLERTQHNITHFTQIWSIFCHCQQNYPFFHHRQVLISSRFPLLLHSQFTPDSDAPTRCSSSHYFCGCMHLRSPHRHYTILNIHLGLALLFFSLSIPLFFSQSFGF